MDNINTNKYILGFISDGFGNKMYMLTHYIHIFFEIKKYQKIDYLYLHYYTSLHEINVGYNIENGYLYNVFPKINKLNFIKWVNWDEYNKLKLNIKRIHNIKNNKKLFNKNFNFKKVNLPIRYIVEYYKNFEKSFYLSDNYNKKIFTFNPNFKKLDKKYNFNIPLIHVRLGDKINYTYNAVFRREKKESIYAICTPKFYSDALKLLNIKSKFIYVSTDSKEIFQKFYSQYIDKEIVFIDEIYYNAFYLFTKFKYMILSDSTLSIFASYMNKDLKKSITHGLYLTHILYNNTKIEYNKNKLFLKNTIKINKKKYLLHNKKKLLNEIYNFKEDK
jgi:hypothetical protein